jgi:hypothetical protein
MAVTVERFTKAGRAVREVAGSGFNGDVWHLNAEATEKLLNGGFRF